MKKKWYKSKAKWTAIVAAVMMVVDAFGIKVPPEVYGILGALGLWSVRDAIKE